MSIKKRNNVHIHGDGPVSMVLAHGFGCDQSMWRFLVPGFAERYRVLTFDLVGSGASDLSAYRQDKYGNLQGYADDVLEMIDECVEGPVVFVGHSVSAIIGMLATISAPSRFAANVMVGPSPCYINEGDYVGGFSRADIDDLLDTMESNYLGWSSSMAPAIMGAPGQPELSQELTNSFCRNDPEIARHFAKTTFLSDHRTDVRRSATPTLVLQCSDDMIAPRSVGEFMQRELPHGVLHLIDNVGHCPHLSAPMASTKAIEQFLDRTLR